MTPLDAWVGCANIAKLKSQLNDPALAAVTEELTRQLSEEERKQALRHLGLLTAGDGAV